jgi:tyrosine-specific transport protein
MNHAKKIRYESFQILVNFLILPKMITMPKTKMYSPELFSAMFLVAGTCIGGGMLAFPVISAASGFLPSIFFMIMAYLGMTATALLFVEVGFWMKKDEAHVISMSSAMLGKWGKAVAWLMFLFISYASLIGYTAGNGKLIAKVLFELGSVKISDNLGAILFMAIAGPILFCSHKVLGKVNSYFFIAMLISYVVLICMGISKVESHHLLRSDWSISWIALPILITSFSFQTMVPSLHPFLGHHLPSLRIAIIGGTTIALVFYLLWQFVILGSVPLEGTYGLAAAFTSGEPATQFLGKALESKSFDLIGCLFSFFALITSFFGFGMGLYDFLADGCNISKRGWGSLLLASMIVFPCLFFATTFDNIFVTALDISGGFGDAILNGVLPVLMVWSGRYYLHKQKSAYAVPGGKKSLVLILLFFTSVFFVEIILRKEVFYNLQELFNR